MLNEERILLMTKMASYEAGEGKKNIAIGKYFRGDYIAIQILKSIVSATISYALVLGLYIIYHLEELMADIYKIDLISFAKNILVYYLITVVAFAVVSYLIHSYRYAKARRNLKIYYYNLKKLGAMYNKRR